MPVFRGVLTEAITESVRDAFSFRRAKTLMNSTQSDAGTPGGPETMLYSDNSIMQFSDDELLEW
jgi:hypothetical protein